MLYCWAFDLVIDVTRFFLLRLRASSKAKRMTRSHPARVKIDVWMATSKGVPRCIQPPASEYSPSVFSRISRQLKGEAHDARAPSTGKNRRLDGDFKGRAAVHPAPCVRILALSIFTDLAPAQRRSA